MKLYDTLVAQLKNENNYVTDDGELKKWVVLSKAQNFDARLIELLLENPILKEKFFIEVSGAVCFNQNLFIQFMEQKNYLNDSYTQYKNKVGLTIGGKYMKQRNEVELVWPFKDCVLEGGQSREEDKREEIFFNETLAQDEITQLLDPKILTNAKVYDKEGEHAFSGFGRDATVNKKRSLPEDTITDNLIIKGNNLLALHSLKTEFAGKVKLIYIDPPFNTGNDSFQYNDSFNHSTWLTFMRNRLYVAKELLKDDGVIFINVDAIEEAYLKVLCDEIFKVENFLNVIAVKSSTPSGTKTAHKGKTIIKQKDLILVYRKTSSAKLNPQFSVREKWDKHYSRYLKGDDTSNFKLVSLVDILLEEEIITSKINVAALDIDNLKFKKFYLKNSERICRLQSHKNKEADRQSRIQIDKIHEHFKDGVTQGLYYNGQVITPLKQSIKKVYKNQKFVNDLGMLLCDFWWDLDFQNTQNEGGVSFPTAKKPELLLSRIIELGSDKNDIVLDFQLGSGTTNAVSMKSNRQFIGIEQLNYGQNDSIKRMQNVVNGDQSGVSKAYEWKGGGSFTHLELKKYNQTFIDQIEEAKDSEDLLTIWEQMKIKSFLNYNVDLQNQDDHIEELKSLDLKLQKEHLIELLDKNQLYVNLSSMNDKDYAISEDEKKATQDFYQISK
jgi:adenine-specific DNA-methyltransferase